MSNKVYYVKFDDDLTGYTVVGDNEWHDLCVNFEPLDNETYFLVAVKYTTGDSMGRNPDPRWEHVELYRTEEEAAETAKIIRKHDDDKRDSRWGRWDDKLKKRIPVEVGPLTYKLCDGTEYKTEYVRWEGYFESLEEIHVIPVRKGARRVY